MLSIWSKIILIPLNTMIFPFYSLSISSMFFLWMMIELNTFIFIFLIILNNDKNKNMMNYFIVQAFTSLLLIYLISLNLDFFNLYILKMINIIVNFVLWIKMGFPPFHYWFINMMKNSSWLSCFIISTSQKFPIFVLWSQIMNMKIINLIIVFSAPFALMNMFTLTNLKLILSFSSIIHSCWMLMNLIFNFKIMLFYYILYSLINLIYMNWLNKWDLENLQNLLKMNSNNLLMFLMLNFSLSSLPPFSGFLMKWFSIENLMFMNLISLMILIYSSIMSIYFYLHISLPGFMDYYLKKKKITLNFNTFNFSISLISILMIIMISLFLTIWMFE